MSSYKKLHNPKTRHPVIIIISAPSGSGKSTIINEMLRRHLPLGFSISATSRPPRGNERDGVEYYFLSPSDFRRRIEQNDFLEYEEVYAGRYYGTLRSEIDRILSLSLVPVFDVDVKGALNIKRAYPDSLSIFIQPPSVDALRHRLLSRATDTPEVIEQRLQRAQFEISFAPRFDRVIINDDLATACDQTYDAILSFINSHHT